MKKRRIGTAVAAAVFLLGAAVLLYPCAAAGWASHYQMRVIEAYQETVDTASQEQLREDLRAAEDYNDALLRGDASGADYAALLSDGGAMAHLEIPAIEVDLPVYHGTDSATLARGIGHLQGTSLPVGGTGTHCVLSAHCGMPEAQLFTGLEKLVEGDRFYLHTLGETLAYRVDQIRVVEPSDTALLRIDPAEDYVTLVTCTPYGVNTHRLLVRGVRVREEENGAVETAAEVKPVRRVTAGEKARWAAGAVGLTGLLLLGTALRKGKKKT